MARLGIDATYLKVRRGGRIVAVAAIIAVGVNPDGRRAVLGMEVGTAEAEPIWTEFLGKLTRWGLRGVKPVIAFVALSASTWQRCRVHFMGNVLAHAGKSGRRIVSAFIATAFAQGEADQRLIRGINRPPNAETASTQRRAVADQIRPKLPKLATIMDRAMVAPPQANDQFLIWLRFF